MENKPTCQMTVSSPTFMIDGKGSGYDVYGKCGKPVKFRVPNPTMGVEYVCGVHARSLDKMFKRIGSDLRCIPLNDDEKN